MNYKSIFKAVGVVSVAAVFSIGCGGNDDDGENGGDGGGGGGSGGLVGDWSIVETRWESDGEAGVDTIPDDIKAFYSFKSSNEIVATTFNKFGDFWIESIQFADNKYSIKGDSICVDGDCMKYSISGNNLTLIGLTRTCIGTGTGSSDGDDYYYYDSCYYSGTSTMKAVKGNISTFKSSLGSNLKSQDPALNRTEWRQSESEYDWDRIEFWGSSYYDSRGVYISETYRSAWYTEGSNRLTLVAMKCDRYETVKEDDYEWERCTSTSVDKIVTLDYQLTNGTLRLKAPGKDWDTWTPYDNYMPKSKAKSKEGKYAIIPFFKDFRR